MPESRITGFQQDDYRWEYQAVQLRKKYLTRFDKEAPEEEPIPDGYNTLDVFRKLLLVRSWCPERALAQSQKYVAQSIGEHFTEAVLLNYELLVIESRPLVPLIGFLAMGSDPTPSIETCAKRMERSSNAVSMGQGQEIHARKLMTKAMVEGSWVLLQNCHLGLEYMVEVLELFVDLEATPEKVHEEFRLWITTEVHPKFPISLLQGSIKYTSEPPSGVKAGVKRTYDSMSQDFLDYSDSPMYLPMIYGISFLHTILQERRKFGPLGWNIPYEFNSSDWYASCLYAQNHLDAMEPGQSVSWNTVRYMVSEVQYGGRVTDDYDMRLLITFLRVWFSDALFSDTFEFYKGYGIMKFKNIQEYLDEIEKMKTTDPPQVYGLHTNADITYQRNTTQKILDTIVSIQPKEASAGGGETREAAVYRMAKEMLGKVPANYDPNEVKERLKFYGMYNSMVIFLRQEIDRMQKVITLVRSTLKDLLLAIDGTIIMNEALRDCLDNIYDARVPHVWLRSSWTSATLGFWFTEFLERNMQFSSWCFTGRPPTFWMTGFFNPQGFLTAMRQEVTRAHKGWALDVVTLHNEVTKFVFEDIKVPPNEGVYVHGLYLEGASWDRRNMRLTESLLKVLYTVLPVIHIFAINSTAPKDPKLYECPVYKKPQRTGLTFITPLWVPTIKNPDHWTLRGVAMLCDIK